MYDVYAVTRIICHAFFDQPPLPLCSALIPYLPPSFVVSRLHCLFCDCSKIPKCLHQYVSLNSIKGTPYTNVQSKKSDTVNVCVVTDRTLPTCNFFLSNFLFRLKNKYIDSRLRTKTNTKILAGHLA